MTLISENSHAKTHRFSIGKKISKKFFYHAEDIQQYGPIFTVWLGPYPVVLISDYELAVDAMVKRGQYFIDRWEPPIVAAMNGMLRLASTLSSFQDFRWQRTGFIKWRLLGRTKTLRFAHLEKFGYLKEHNGRKDHGRVPFEASMTCLSSFPKI